MEEAETKSILKRAGEEDAGASTGGENTDSLTAINTDKNRGAGRKKRSAKKGVTGGQKQQFERMLRSNAKMLRFVLKVQERLLGPGVPPDSLARAAQILRPAAFDEVVLERANESLCGWPCCAVAIDLTANKEQKYRISRAQQKVYDTTEGTQFCSHECLMAAGASPFLSYLISTWQASSTTCPRRPLQGRFVG